MIYLKSLKYILIHKWYAMLELFKEGLYWRGIMHDMSKFGFDELIPYARYFYGVYPSIKDIHGDARNLYLSAGCYKEKVEEDFNLAWLYHQKRNLHHWQYWILQKDDGGIKILDMPNQYIREMLCDWLACGKALNSTETTAQWYKSNKQNILLSSDTQTKLDQYLKEPKFNEKRGL